MALDFNVQGPIGLWIRLETDGPAALQLLGYTTNQSLFSMDMQRSSVIAESTDQGDEPGDVIHAGTVCVVSGVLSKWDIDFQAALKALVRAPGGVLEGDAGLIGQRWIKGPSTAADPTTCFEAELRPATPDVGAYVYNFPRCYGDENMFGFTEHGNTPQFLPFTFTAIRKDVANQSTLR